MRTVLIFALLVAAAQSMIVCPPNFCKSVKCDLSAVQNCGGRVQQKGSMCGCCDVCIHQLEEGDSCSATLLLGSPPSSECGEGLFCDINTSKCRRQTCAMSRALVLARIEESRRQGQPLLGATPPTCDADGTYSAKQCIEASCFCVNKDGDRLGDYSARFWEAKDMTCNCARDEDEYQKKGLIGKMYICNENGNYEKYQCTGSVCYCVDEKGSKLESTPPVSISAVKTLNC
ncbi:uncharacterized protein LOC106163748 [Lingula anatina]|uniref:Uncharacterized protein LOC106163748 n=1 Tax=Lingula anatina TaxID=7574 RepID=A0A1S3IF36_LINAN|nr:uncharacterized protein LOC106163748 [Lingula anatina]|eukprot:XP_013396880.1 uncharacterized protein LOC106163748 [Lingula anatina]